MSAVTENIALVQALYAAYRGSDYETFAALCTPDLVWEQCAGFPYGGIHHGPAAVVEGVFETLPRHWDGFGYDVEQMLDAGTAVVVLGAYVGTHRETRRSFRAATTHVFDIEAGRIRRFRQYTDTAPVVAAAGI